MVPAKNKPSAQFWSWFSERHEEYRNVGLADDRERLLDLFQRQLHQYDNELYFEISRSLEDGSNELIITAQGRSAKFSKVEALVAAAPELPRWTIIAFKPALGFDFVHEHGELEIDPRKLWFLPLTAKSDPLRFGLRVGLPEFDEACSDRIKNCVWIILDTGLGEKLSAEKIKHVEVAPLPDNPANEGFMELPELPDYLRWIDKRNANASE